MNQRMPAIFIGHGNPMNAIQDTVWSRAWIELGKRLPRPRAILSISAHWYVPKTAATAMTMPRTIHDFSGFPQALFDITYPAPGDPALVERLQTLLVPDSLHADLAWGLDHGTWSVLHHIFPDADIPVVQLSINQTKSPTFHYELGQRLSPLREEGILLLGSGNVVHNLQTYAWQATAPVSPLDWATRFETTVCELISSGDYTQLVNYSSLGQDAKLAVPTPEHYLPLLYILGASNMNEAIKFPIKGITGGSISMLAVEIN